MENVKRIAWMVTENIELLIHLTAVYNVWIIVLNALLQPTNVKYASRITNFMI
jgi:hypothetical protein